MNKLNKIFFIVIIILILALSIMTVLYINMKKVALLNYYLYQSSSELVNQLETEKNISE